MPRKAISSDILRTKVSAGIRIPDIARELGFNPKSVWKACLRYGIEVPKPQRHDPPPPKLSKRRVKPVVPKPPDPMIGVWYDTDERACRREGMFRMAKPFEWHSHSE